MKYKIEGYVSPFVWCPNDVIMTSEGKKNNTVGPNMHVNVCLSRGCCCDNLEKKIEELNDNKILNT